MPDPPDPHRDLAGVLHDVSNALTVLLGWVGEARAGDATPEAVAYALGIIEQRARIARDLARHAIGSPRLDEQRELGVVVRGVAEELRVEASRHGARIEVEGLEDRALVPASLDLGQVLTNLALNALAHAPRGSTVRLRVGVEDAVCAVEVSDEGPGVSPARREAIFLGDSLRPGGLGVGLRHARALAQAAGGDVVLVPPDPGGEADGGAMTRERGARFRLTWPRADAVPRPPISTARSTARVSELSGLRVLVIEDDAAVSQLLEAALEARGADVVVVRTAGELHRWLGAAGDGPPPFDAALVDLSPIAADIAGAFATLRAYAPEALLVLVTGNADAVPEAALAVRIELVRKPFEIREVLAVVARGARAADGLVVTPPAEDA